MLHCRSKQANLRREVLDGQRRELFVNDDEETVLDEEGADVPGGKENGRRPRWYPVHHLADQDRRQDADRQINATTRRVYPLKQK